MASGPRAEKLAQSIRDASGKEGITVVLGPKLHAVRVTWGLPLFGIETPDDNVREELLQITIRMIQEDDSRFRPSEDLTLRVSKFMGPSWTWHSGEWVTREPTGPSDV